MSLELKHCPSTLAKGYDSYSRTALMRLFSGKKVYHVLPYNAPTSTDIIENQFTENQIRISISGVQEKFSLLLEKNKLRLAKENEQGTYILKPIPRFGKRREQMPANEHLTMQIARQVFGIETAENALIFFQDGSPAYITKRFDVQEVKVDSKKIFLKLAQEDFASLAKKTPQTHGENYKYQGSYLELFELLRENLPVYKLEAPKLFKLLLFNYLFSNGDAHIKNFSILETSFGDFRLSPAYDLLNSRIHIEDKDFALDEGLLPKNISSGKIGHQFTILAEMADIPELTYQNIMKQMLSNTENVGDLIEDSFLDLPTKRNYLQNYQAKLKQLSKN